MMNTMYKITGTRNTSDRCPYCGAVVVEEVREYTDCRAFFLAWDGDRCRADWYGSHGKNKKEDVGAEGTVYRLLVPRCKQ